MKLCDLRLQSDRRTRRGGLARTLPRASRVWRCNPRHIGRRSTQKHQRSRTDHHRRINRGRPAHSYRSGSRRRCLRRCARRRHSLIVDAFGLFEATVADRSRVGCRTPSRRVHLKNTTGKPPALSSLRRPPSHAPISFFGWNLRPQNATQHRRRASSLDQNRPPQARPDEIKPIRVKSHPFAAPRPFSKRSTQPPSPRTLGTHNRDRQQASPHSSAATPQ